MEPCDRALLSRMFRICAAMEFDDRDHPARDQRLEMANVHGWLFVPARLCRCWYHLLDGGCLRARLILFTSSGAERRWLAASTRLFSSAIWEIGRASCRERVCQ